MEDIQQLKDILVKPTPWDAPFISGVVTEVNARVRKVLKSKESDGLCLKNKLIIVVEIDKIMGCNVSKSSFEEAALLVSDMTDGELTAGSFRRIIAGGIHPLRRDMTWTWKYIKNLNFESLGVRFSQLNIEPTNEFKRVQTAVVSIDNISLIFYRDMTT